MIGNGGVVWIGYEGCGNCGIDLYFVFVLLE